MEKFIPYEKLSKKEKRKINQARRQTWGKLNPLTRKPENSKAYNRNKARNWKRESEPIPGYSLHIVVFCPLFDQENCRNHNSHPFCHHNRIPNAVNTPN